MLFFPRVIFRSYNNSKNLVVARHTFNDILQHYPELQSQLQRAVILIDNEVAAVTFGELLNRQTAVIHIEKKNLEIPELYTVINQ